LREKQSLLLPGDERKTPTMEQFLLSQTTKTTTLLPYL